MIFFEVMRRLAAKGCCFVETDAQHPLPPAFDRL